MSLPVAQRALVLGLVAACVALLPFLRDDLGESSTFLPICLTAIVLCNLLTSALVLAQFLARGSAPLLGLAAAYFAAGLLAVVHLLVLPGALTHDGVLEAGGQSASWLWAVGHGGLPLGLAAALWGGPPAFRRRLAGPTVRRARAAILTGLAIAGGAAGLTWALVAFGGSLPDVTDGAKLSPLGLAATPVVLGLDLLALVVVARRGRRSPLERRLLLVVACMLAGTALTLLSLSRFSVGWYASVGLELVASAIVLATLLRDVGRLGTFGAADARAGAFDALTGARTRAATLVAAEHLHRSRAPGRPLALALVDVDGLKAIGDQHGPLAADAVLLTVANRLRGQLRDGDVLGRSGDEGFLIVLPGTDADGVTLAVDRAVAAVRDQPVGTWAHDVRTTASGGIAMVGAGDDAIAVALAAADMALNQAKAHGRDQVVSPARAQVVPLRRAAAGPPRG
ncbi:MAG TPA: sensor domain-containing diguanylate cyclase [Baekduia sp.]|uniref:GGDEF domain-containing protein n=1 Tax=Baekduia sp. TaxID=2600305 RepID=UPI002BCED156|nr:sensor domain-containing diguanylate cyclase [Baekduia sp.]HMJ35673.1 sensor domain-containing diguanylate cyclase [Baekduia sp.]